jgi:uncharacterized protein with HEPN domain
MSKRSDRDFLIDILEAARRIEAYRGTISYDAFLADTKTQVAIIRNLEVIGEAAKSLTVELRARYPDLAWRSMAGARDRLIHGYFGVNLDIVWYIVTQELPVAASRMIGIVEELDRG